MNINNVKTLRELNKILKDNYECDVYIADDFLPIYELRKDQKILQNFNQFESLKFFVRKLKLYKL